ncbi:MAG: hypothetical protein HY303_05350, partial [Candidatus Wallbacteria bacterium]|nr:hypothetical protein [Candidatus Wallbacteria bacterium]
MSAMPTRHASLATRIGNLELTRCVMNAAGPRSLRPADLEALVASASGAVVMKSATLCARDVEPESYLYEEPGGAVSIYTDRLENLGCEAHAAILSGLRAKSRKPVVASLAGNTPDEFAHMAEVLGKAADALELNFACPSPTAKSQLGFDLATCQRILASTRRATAADLWVKLPPYQDIGVLEAMGDLLRKSGVQAAVAVGSPAGLDVDVESESLLIAPRHGMTGIGGHDVARIARWNIRELHRVLG